MAHGTARRTARRAVASLVLGWLVAALGVRAEPVELVLAVDSSFSVDLEEFDLQMEGLARAFRTRPHTKARR